MRKLTKKGSGAIAVLIIAIGAIWFFFTHTQKIGGSAATQIAEPALEGLSSVGETETDLDQVESITTDSPTLEARGKRIVEVPDTRQESETSMSSPEQEYVDSISEKIESALGGDTKDTWTIVRHVYNCSQGPGNEATLNSAIEHYKAIGPGIWPTLSEGPGLAEKRFDSMEEWADAQWRRIQDCQSTKHLFGYDYRSRIRAEAENGNVAARFMYAMWPPPVDRETELIFGWLEYTNLAYEFSMQNVKEGEPLGFLALGLSHLAVNFFTPSQLYVGVTLLLAAEKCGLQKINMDGYGPWYSSARESDQTQETAEAFVLEFCE